MWRWVVHPPPFGARSHACQRLSHPARVTQALGGVRSMLRVPATSLSLWVTSCLDVKPVVMTVLGF